jgi:hypothetical protein
MTPAQPARRPVARSLRAPVLWGVVVGAIQVASPLAFWWLDPATVYALGLALIAAVYIGFAVADGRPPVIVVESAVAGLFVALAAAGVTGSAWLLVLGFTGHGLKDLWQHRSHYVAGTRWWPPFCLIVDWVVAAVLVVLIIVSIQFHD